MKVYTVEYLDITGCDRIVKVKASSLSMAKAHASFLSSNGLIIKIAKFK